MRDIAIILGVIVATWIIASVPLMLFGDWKRKIDKQEREERIRREAAEAHVWADPVRYDWCDGKSYSKWTCRACGLSEEMQYWHYFPKCSVRAKGIER
jgi:hypothetical protein